MDSMMTRRIVCPQLQDPGTARAAMRWALRFPGVLSAGVQHESRELVLTYDLRCTTLADIRRHLERGGVSCDASLIQRCHLLAVDHAERTQRVMRGIASRSAPTDLPLVALRST